MVVAYDVPDDIVRLVFLPLGFGLFAGWSRADLEEVVLFAVLDADNDAGRSINGYPMFLERRL